MTRGLTAQRAATARLITEYMARGGASKKLTDRVRRERIPIVACEWESPALEAITRCKETGHTKAVILIRRGEGSIYALNASELAPEGIHVTEDDCGPQTTMGQVWDTLQDLFHQSWRVPSSEPRRVRVEDVELTLA